MMSKKINHIPAIYIALIVILSMVTINIGYLLARENMTFVRHWDVLGIDYRDFFQASESLLNGDSPYSVERYVTTPLPAILNTVLVTLGFEKARNLIILVVFLSMLFSYWIINRIFVLHEGLGDPIILLSGFIVIAFSYPFYFLLERANIDSLVLLLFCSGLYFAKKEKMDWISAFLFVLAIAMKLYPALLILPIVLYRRWKLLLWIGFWMLILGLLFIPWYGELNSALANRAQSSFQFDENGSIVNTVVYIIFIINSKVSFSLISPAPIYAALVYGVLVSMVIYADFRAGRKATIDQFLEASMMYIPFMVVLPQIAYHYEFISLILLIPISCILWGRNANRTARIALIPLVTGIALSQWQAIALFNLTGNWLANAIPGFGAFLAMIGITFYKLATIKGEVESKMNLERQAGTQNQSLRQSMPDAQISTSSIRRFLHLK